MAFNNRQVSAGRGALRGSRFQQPFRSPLRVSSTENVELKSSANVAKSPVIYSVNRRSPNVVSPLCNRESGEGVQENSESMCGKNVQEGTGSYSTTPKRPLSSSGPRGGGYACHRKVSPRPFSTPFRSPVSSVGSPQQTLSKEEELSQLLGREEELDKEISSLKALGCKVEELQGHIDNLHEYNEIKDAAQLVMGRLAELEGVTAKEMHEKYNVTILE